LKRLAIAKKYVLLSVMTVTLNDKQYDTPEGASLADFIATLGLSPQGIAIAIGEAVVPKSRWKDTLLTDGEELMLIHAVSGG
jgi:sulfur carrier protein